ncbi:hypothetical protein MIR68_001549 [Amoeboaphelidium protococcarum]|nr:hypothetical protein MIR68_001549 [Amoeboaphelidium protococcarum]
MPLQRSSMVLICKGRQSFEAIYIALNQIMKITKAKSARMLAVSQKFIQMTELNVAWLRVGYWDLRSQLDYAAEIDRAFKLLRDGNTAHIQYWWYMQKTV